MDPHHPVVVALPIADRRRAHDFYRAVLGSAAIGEPADDGIAEPLQFELNDGFRIMLVPSDGFGWIIGDRTVAPDGSSECVVTLTVDDDREVDRLMGAAVAAGAATVIAAGSQPWGHAAAFADPDGHVWMLMSPGVASG